MPGPAVLSFDHHSIQRHPEIPTTPTNQAILAQPEASDAVGTALPKASKVSCEGHRCTVMPPMFFFGNKKRAYSNIFVQLIGALYINCSTVQNKTSWLSSKEFFGTSLDDSSAGWSSSKPGGLKTSYESTL